LLAFEGIDDDEARHLLPACVAAVDPSLVSAVVLSAGRRRCCYCCCSSSSRFIINRRYNLRDWQTHSPLPWPYHHCVATCAF
jgi:hypothetical protein